MKKHTYLVLDSWAFAALLTSCGVTVTQGKGSSGAFKLEQCEKVLCAPGEHERVLRFYVWWI